MLSIPRFGRTVDLVTLIANDIGLKRNGHIYFGKCPFHADKTASLAVYPTPQRRAKPFFRCFGCGATGDAIEWIRLTRKVPFAEALRILGQEAPKPDPVLIAARKAEQRREQQINAYRNRAIDCCCPDWLLDV